MAYIPTRSTPMPKPGGRRPVAEPLRDAVQYEPASILELLTECRDAKLEMWRLAYSIFGVGCFSGVFIGFMFSTIVPIFHVLLGK